MFDKLSATLALRRLTWEEGPCPICNTDGKDLLIARDRYLQKINISQCVKCGHIFSARHLSNLDIGIFYKNIYRQLYENTTAITPDYIYQSRDKLKAAYRYSQISQTIGTIGSVVEIGSGLGFFLRECLDQGIENVVGFEPNTTFCNFAIDTLELGGRVFNNMYEGYSDHLPNANLFVLFHVLEHLENPEHLLSLIARKIGNGWLVLEVPDIEQGWESLGRFNFHLGHRHYFCIETLGSLLKKAGFGIVSYATAIDDGIYPGNLRIFARLRDLTEVDFIKSFQSRRQIIREKVLRYGRAWGIKNGTLRAALRLIKP